MDDLTRFLEISASQHNHLCPRQVLGVRMGMLAAKLFALTLPQENKRLLAFVETDGCLVDGIAAATGCTAGHRTMRIVDYGKTAVTFVDTNTETAYRVHPHPQVRERARLHQPEARSRWHAQLEAYKTLPDELLLVWQPVMLNESLAAIISRPGVRVNCDRCGEEIINEREVVQVGQVLCRACAGESYYTVLTDAISLPMAEITVAEVAR